MMATKSSESCRLLNVLADDAYHCDRYVMLMVQRQGTMAACSHLCCLQTQTFRLSNSLGRGTRDTALYAMLGQTISCLPGC